MHVITVENVWKRYRKGQTGYHTLREDLYNITGRLLDFGGEKRRNKDAEHIWALHDVSFEVKQGERVGIIGRNGSGKTTLLRLLAGITRPTHGKISVKGRMGVLIELMAGFHPELTGRENIYLNGAIMGMSHKEIKRKFDEIVAFSELEDFIDTPIKRYSSGMHVRLGFAVAAHLDPDILLVDEVLAVGDAAFQQKCLGKMEGAAQEGRTVVFVSHNMAAVRNLCQSCILLEGGAIATSGDTDYVIAKYNEGISSRLGVPISERLDRGGTGEVVCTKVYFLDASKNEVPFLYSGQPCFIRLDFESKREMLSDVKVGVGIDTPEGTRILTLYSDFTGQSFSMHKKGGSFLCSLGEGFNLRPGMYTISTFLGNERGAFDVVLNAAMLDIRDADFYGTGRLPDRAQGPMLVSHTWSLI